MVQEILKQCMVKENVVYLPAQKLDRKIYQEVAKQLNLIGGIWKGGKIGGFLFNEDPTELLAQIAEGEKRNLKKEFQFFGTPDVLAEQLVILANPKKTNKILEPSAGQGVIVNAINKYCEPSEIFCYELMPLNQTFLNKIKNINLLGDDFLLAPEKNKYDIIIANPPFSKNQDIEHIYKMYSLLVDKGRLVTMCSPHYQNSSNKKELAFKQWLYDINADIQDVPAGMFKESGTNIRTLIITINK